MSQLLRRVLSVLLVVVASCLLWQNWQVDAATTNVKLVLVKGTIYKDKAPIGKGMVTTYSQATNKAYYSTIKNGKFQLSVPVGEYSIHSYTDDVKKTVGNIYQSFSVHSSKLAPSIKIQLKEDNIKGSVQLTSGKITAGTLHVIKHDQGSTKYVTVINNNQFQLALSNGTYTAFQYYDKSKAQYGQLNTTFTVSNGKLTTTSLKIKDQPNNVSGTVHLQSKKAIHGTVKIECQTCVRPTAYIASVKNGKYEASLPNGQYKISAIYNQSTKKTNRYSFVFEIRSAKLTAPKTAMALVVEDRDNQKGTIEKGDKPIAKGNLFIHPTNGEGYFYYPSILNGKFTTYLKDGSYQIDGYYDELQQQNVPLEKPIKLVIASGKSSFTHIDISLKADNFIGTVLKAGKAITKGTIYAETDKFKRVVSINNGKFSAFLADGTYTIQKARDEVAYLDYEFEPIIVKVEGGKLTSSKPLKINILEDNVTGMFTTSSGALKSGAFYVIADTGKEYKFPIIDGKFSIYLPDGTYAIGPIFDYGGGTKSIDFSFTVKDGKLVGVPSLRIEIGDDNVTGLVTIAGSPATRGLVRISGAKGGLYTSDVFNGQFSILLPDGEYKITEFENYTTQRKIELGMKFTVIGGKTSPIEISLSGDNFAGTIIKSGNPIKMGAIVLYSGMGNHHTVNVVDNRYSGNLPDGVYRVIAVVDKTTNLRYELSIPVTIVDGKQVGSISIIVLEHNVKISVENSVKLLSGRLELKERGGKVYSFAVQEGRVGTYLPDGDYYITSFFTESGLQIPLSISFSVKEGMANPELVKIKIPENNIQGTVTKAGKMVENGYLIVESSLASYSIPIVSGKISIYLPDGDYKIVRSFDRTLYKESEEDIPFTVSGGKPSINPFTIELKEDNVQGLLNIGTAPAKDGTIYILTKDKNKNYHFFVRNGVFSGSLPNGEYLVVQYNSYDGVVSRKLSQEFTIVGGKLSEPIKITLPENNFSGTVEQSGEIIRFGRISVINKGKMEVFSVRISEGRFSDYLADGEYMIENVFSSTRGTHYEEIHFEVKDGQISISTAIKLKDHNVSGAVWKNNSSINGSIQIMLENGNFRDTLVITNGKFSLYLPNGKYMVSNIWNQDGTSEKFEPTSFVVSDGRLVGSLDIYLQ